MSARAATPDDADELVRLRAVMLQTFGDPQSWNDDWRAPSLETLRQRLTGPGSSMAAFVVDRPGGDALAACAVGIIEERLGNPHNLSGRTGYVFSVSTDPEFRRRGYARACMDRCSSGSGRAASARSTCARPTRASRSTPASASCARPTRRCGCG